MRRIRVIPTLLIDSDGGVVKTVKFGKRTYIGDPINAVKIFNDKGADELLLLDIDATVNNRSPNFKMIEEIASEAFMPVGYGGGVRTIKQIADLFRCGLEKIVLSTSSHETPELIRDAADRFGSQSIVCCLEVKRSLLGKHLVYTKSGKYKTGNTAIDAAKSAVKNGAGEIIVYSIDRDGTMGGFDLELLKTISVNVDTPVIACGGAASISDLRSAVIEAHCSAAAAGSMFVFQGRERGVLINYPNEDDLRDQLFSYL